MNAPILSLVARFVPASQLTEREFLPAALEIIETPASPTIRMTAGLISLFFVIALIWSYFGRVDIIATAPGKIIARARTKIIQPYEIGVVRAIHVAEGDRVEKGQLLIELDPTVPQADRVQYQEELAEARLDQIRLRALLDPGTGLTGRDPFTGVSAPPDLVAAARARLDADASEEQEKIAKNDREIAEKRAEEASVDAEIAKIDAALPLVAARRDIREEGAKAEFGSKIAYLQQAQELAEMQHERVATESKRDAAAASISELTIDRQVTESEFKSSLLEDLAKADREATEAQNELVKAQQQIALDSLTAPVTGTVQDLAVQTLGGVVTPAQQLLRIVPSEGGVEVEAAISNDDVGFIDVGQDAEIKIATFPFTRYGLIHGRVREVARDSVVDPQTDQRNAGTQSADDEPHAVKSAGDLLFGARIVLDKTMIAVDGKEVALEPGMAVTAEIKTGRRRVIDYLLSPFRRQVDESLHER